MLYAHLQIAAKNSQDSMLVEILSYKDSHSYLTSKMLKLGGVDRSREYCEENKKTDKQVAEYRSIAKTALY